MVRPCPDPLSASRSCNTFIVLAGQQLASPPVLELAWSAGIVALAVQMPQSASDDHMAPVPGLSPWLVDLRRVHQERPLLSHVHR